LRPSSAKERTEKREDKLVRKGIEKVSRRIGDVNSANESDSEGSSSGGRGSRKGKERAAGIVGGLGEDGVSSTTIPAKPSETIAGSRSTRSKAPKEVSLVQSRDPRLAVDEFVQASWNPNLLPTQPQSESSDFDSSDLAYDSPGEAGPSTPRTRLSMTPPAPRDVVMTLASTPKLQERGIGGALKGADGEVVSPRMITRTARKVSAGETARPGADAIPANPTQTGR